MESSRGEPKISQVIPDASHTEPETKFVVAENPEESACWCCGGFTRNSKFDRTWSCYLCCGSKTTETADTIMETKWYYPLCFGCYHKSSEFNKTTNQYIKRDISSCLFTPFCCLCEKTLKSYSEKSYCWWLPFAFSHGAEIEDNGVHHKKSHTFCISPFNVINKKTNDELVDYRSAVGVVPLFCLGNDGHERQICGTIGLCSFCHRTDFDTRESNYCCTTLYGPGYCKRGRCCMLKDQPTCCNNRYLNWMRYFDPAEYHFCGEVDLKAKTRSAVLCGLGYCELSPLTTVPAHTTTETTSLVSPPVRQIMGSNVKEVPITATKKFECRGICGNFTKYYK